MPHLVLQHSRNVELGRMQAACNALHGAMVEAGIFPLGGIRVRALACEAYAIADRHEANSFVDMLLRMGAGRSAEQKKAAGELIMQKARQFFEDELSKPHFALSLEVIEIDEVLSWKVNSIHPRLKSKS